MSEKQYSAKTDDYSRNKVPQESTFSGLHIALVIIGGTIGIPIFLMAAQIGGSLGLSRAIPAFLIGSLVLGIMGAMTSYAGAKTRLSTYMLTEFAFGRNGAKVVNAAIALSLIGWYGVIANVFAQAADMVIQDIYQVALPIWIYAIVGSALMVAVSLSGFRGIDKLALVLVPVMLLFLGYTAVLSSGELDSREFTGTLSRSDAISAVIGSYIAGVVIQPDYSRFARNIRHAIWAAFIGLGISFPVVQTLAAVPSIATGEQDLIQIMMLLGIGLPAFLLLLLGSWSSNVLCLYSSGLSLSTVFTKIHLRHLLTIIGVTGTAIAFVQAQSYLVNFLLILGVAIPPVASIYIWDVLILRRGRCDVEKLETETAINISAFIAWAVGMVVGYLAMKELFTVSAIASLDAIITTLFTYGLLSKIKLFRQGSASNPVIE